MRVVNEVLAGRYRLVEPIATGGMGTVWRAHDEVLERAVALKILNEALAADPSASERFRREALTAASITHPHMANVFDYVEENGRPGIVMELVHGETLAHLLARERRLPVGEAVRIASDILTALEAAHEAGIIHRDIKPGNVLIAPNGHVKLGDFGIARSLSDASLTLTGTVMGTAHYSSPEQVKGESATPATDLYSVGIVLYEMLCGSRPFKGDTPVAVAMARLEAPPPAPRSLRPDVPPGLDAAVMRALARDRADRFGTASEMRAALIDASGQTAARRRETAVIAVGHADPTLAMGTVTPTPHGQAVPAAVAERIPPRWAWKRLGLFLLPLVLLALLAFGLAAAMGRGDGKVTTKPSVAPSAKTTPTVSLIGRVPNLVGLSFDRAKDLLNERQLNIIAVGSDYSSYAKGSIIAQNPSAGSKLRPGDTISVSLSDGPQPQISERRCKKHCGKGNDD